MPVIIGTQAFTPVTTSTAGDLITRALRRIGAIAQGETAPDPDTANDCLAMLNDWIEQLSNEKQMIFAVDEVVHGMTAGKFIYTIGQPGNDVGCSFTGSISQNILTVTAIASGALNVGQVVQGPGIQSGTVISSLGTGLGGSGTSALGTYTIYPPNTFGSGALTSFHPLPTRINSAIVRVTTSIAGSLDYPVKPINVNDYELIGLKALNGPWPKLVYFERSMPQGVLRYWPNPNTAVEMHLFCDKLLTSFPSLTSPINFPLGYKLFLRFGLAELLLPDFGKKDPAMIELVTRQAGNARAWLKATNARPAPEMQFDPNLLPSMRKDAGWILHGGFN